MTIEGAVVWFLMTGGLIFFALLITEAVQGWWRRRTPDIRGPGPLLVRRGRLIRHRRIQVQWPHR